MVWESMTKSEIMDKTWEGGGIIDVSSFHILSPFLYWHMPIKVFDLT